MSDIAVCSWEELRRDCWTISSHNEQTSKCLIVIWIFPILVSLFNSNRIFDHDMVSVLMCRVLSVVSFIIFILFFNLIYGCPYCDRHGSFYLSYVYVGPKVVCEPACNIEYPVIHPVSN